MRSKHRRLQEGGIHTTQVPLPGPRAGRGAHGHGGQGAGPMRIGIVNDKTALQSVEANASGLSEASSTAQQRLCRRERPLRQRARACLAFMVAVSRRCTIRFARPVRSAMASTDRPLSRSLAMCLSRVGSARRRSSGMAGDFATTAACPQRPRPARACITRQLMSVLMEGCLPCGKGAELRPKRTCSLTTNAARTGQKMDAGLTTSARVDLRDFSAEAVRRPKVKGVN